MQYNYTVHYIIIIVILLLMYFHFSGARLHCQCARNGAVADRSAAAIVRAQPLGESAAIAATVARRLHVAGAPPPGEQPSHRDPGMRD